MFLTLPLSEKTLADVFSLHLAVDSGLLSDYLVSEAFLRALFVVCSSFTRPLGLLLFCEDFSVQHGRGLYVDSYYVPAGLRVFFLNRDDLPQLYSKMGFCNETLHDQIQLLSSNNRSQIYGFSAVSQLQIDPDSLITLTLYGHALNESNFVSFTNINGSLFSKCDKLRGTNSLMNNGRSALLRFVRTQRRCEIKLQITAARKRSPLPFEVLKKLRRTLGSQVLPPINKVENLDSDN